jgi:hypothetical protein
MKCEKRQDVLCQEAGGVPGVNYPSCIVLLGIFCRHLRPLRVEPAAYRNGAPHGPGQGAPLRQISPGGQGGAATQQIYIQVITKKKFLFVVQLLDL